MFSKKKKFFSSASMDLSIELCMFLKKITNIEFLALLKVPKEEFDNLDGLDSEWTYFLIHWFVEIVSVYNDTISYMLVSKTHNQGIKALQFMVPLKQID